MQKEDSKTPFAKLVTLGPGHLNPCLSYFPRVYEKWTCQTDCSEITKIMIVMMMTMMTVGVAPDHYYDNNGARARYHLFPPAAILL